MLFSPRALSLGFRDKCTCANAIEAKKNEGSPRNLDSEVRPFDKACCLVKRRIFLPRIPYRNSSPLRLRFSHTPNGTLGNDRGNDFCLLVREWPFLKQFVCVELVGCWDNMELRYCRWLLGLGFFGWLSNHPRPNPSLLLVICRHPAPLAMEMGPTHDFVCVSGSQETTVYHNYQIPPPPPGICTRDRPFSKQGRAGCTVLRILLVSSANRTRQQVARRVACLWLLRGREATAVNIIFLSLPFPNRLTPWLKTCWLREAIIPCVNHIVDSSYRCVSPHDAVRACASKADIGYTFLSIMTPDTFRQHLDVALPCSSATHGEGRSPGTDRRTGLILQHVQCLYIKLIDAFADQKIPLTIGTKLVSTS